MQQRGGAALAIDFHGAEARRRERWGQTPDTRLAGPDEAAAFIARLGIATLFPASPEVPNLFHAYLGDPAARPDAGHDSPSGTVYGWRWALGREAAFYGAVVRDRPTWVAWDVLPAVLRLRGETRPPEELYALGQLSADALHLAEALASAGGILSTGELRRAAGFPAGKARRAAYLKAVAELDARLLLAKVFTADDLDMSHALVDVRYPAQAAAAGQLSREEALDRLLRAYLPAAVYAAPAPLARHLKLAGPELAAALDRLVAAGVLAATALPGRLGKGYIWQPPGETGRE